MSLVTETIAKVKSSIHKDRSKPKAGENKETVLLKERAKVRKYSKTAEGLQQMIADLDAQTNGGGLAHLIERAEVQLATDDKNRIRSGFDRLYKGESGEYYMDLAFKQGIQDATFVTKMQELFGKGYDLARMKTELVKPIADQMAASGTGNNGAWEDLIEARGADASGGDDEE